MQSTSGSAVGLAELVSYAKDLGLEASLQRIGEDRDDDEYGEGVRETARIDVANGRESRTLFIRDVENVPALLSAPLADLVFLGDYDAFVDRSTGVIEAFVGRQVAGRMQFAPITAWRLPGAEVISETNRFGRPVPEDWRLQFEDAERVIEISPATDLAQALIGRGRPSSRNVSVKLKGFRTERHDEALRDLEEATRSTFFDLDVMYNFGLSLRRAALLGSLAPTARSKSPMDFPKNSYPKSAVELYNYGRDAVPFPLLQFLAFYQVLEYFFPAYARAETTTAIRNAIRHPAFNVNDDSDVSRLISLAAPAVQAGIGERQQLASTIRGVVQPSEVIAEVERIESVTRVPSFTSKKQAIPGLEPIRLSPSDVLGQLADRIYNLRCRVVHTKSDGGSADELLLPNSREAHELRREIPLLQFIVQKAIVAGAGPMR